jgi:hypothetical protein
MPSADDRTHAGCLFGPRVRFPDASTDRFYTYPMTSNTASLVLAVTFLHNLQLDELRDSS